MIVAHNEHLSCRLGVCNSIEVRKLNFLNYKVQYSESGFILNMIHDKGNYYSHLVGMSWFNISCDSYPPVHSPWW